MPFIVAALPAIAAITAVVGTGLSAVSMISQGAQQSAALKSQAQAQRYNQQAMLTNAQIAEQNAKATEASGA